MAKSSINFFRLRFRNETPFYVYALLFGATFLTCSIAGAQWLGLDYTTPVNWLYGSEYAMLILAFLGAHEFGHFLAAKYHNVNVTLPFFIPFPFTFMLNYGTFGAVIKTREKIPTRKALFDIGIAGPLAGFAMCLLYLAIGFSILPDRMHSFAGHSNSGLYYGETLLFTILYALFDDGMLFLPAMNQIQAFPYLNVAWFGLFVTTLNLLPIGQLDGGHISYAMFGGKQKKIARVVWGIMLFFGILALLGVIHEFLGFDFESRIMNVIKGILYPPLDVLTSNFPFLFGAWFGWLLWGILLRFLVKLEHPPLPDTEKLGSGRMILGWLAFLILILSFSFRGVYLLE